ncbi:unnamed protein product [Clonostachys rhizophaga]|uniref:ADP-ribosylglycohydrolase n=2 Tax=Clonostachys rhizophaga TaxID=160324 RepID=A0A9N9YK11_9HYPO|nr:unnamed protein product [Clonostachys rhizophaga]
MAGHATPEDYLERTYAGVLGKLVGVYLGRPFEQWTYQRILKELGPIHYYVHDKVKSPLVVTDDDVSGTFVFIRALEEHGISADTNFEAIAEDVGRTWLNNTVEKKSIFWWGGRGISTEHTAYLNLKHGIKAPASGSIETNGKTVAEQIGGQIFIDGWGLVAPGNPSLAAKLARAAASVSHDGVSAEAAVLWAAMEAEAFKSKDVNHLLSVGLSFISDESPLRRLIADIRQWAETDQDWEKTRQRIEDNYGYDKYKGPCHVIPNHGLMILALVYGGDSFHKAMHIINTAGWDTDCNSGNIGCLVALMHGMASFEGGPDWTGPLADRALVSSADGGYSVNNAARIAYDVANSGRRLAGQDALPSPKAGAQFHFTLPGSVQGFMVGENKSPGSAVDVHQEVDHAGRTGLAIHIDGLSSSSPPVEVLSQVFTPTEVQTMKKTYDLMASPLVYPGQTVTAALRADGSNSQPVAVNLRLKHYTVTDTLLTRDGPSTTLAPNGECTLRWQIPDEFDSLPIQQLGLALTCAAEGDLKGVLRLESLSYGGTPNTVLKRPSALAELPRELTRPGVLFSFWSRAWIHNLDTFALRFPEFSFWIAQDHGEGILTTGARDWTDYTLTVPGLMVSYGSAGVAVRVRGLNRYYAFVFKKGAKEVAVVKARDESRTELACVEYPWDLDTTYSVQVRAQGATITAFVNGTQVVAANDDEYEGGGIGAIATTGSVGIHEFRVGPCS